MNMNAAMSAYFYQALANIHTATPAIIEGYDSSTHIASVRPIVNHKLDNGFEAELPIIEGVPVIFPCTEKFCIDFPLNKGDGVLLIVCEADLGDWKDSDGKENVSPLSTLRFQLGSSVAIPGLMPKYSESSFTLSIDNDGVLTFKGKKMVFNCPVVCNENVIARKDVFAGEDTSGYSLTSHVHTHYMGPTLNITPMPNPTPEL